MSPCASEQLRVTDPDMERLTNLLQATPGWASLCFLAQWPGPPEQKCSPKSTASRRRVQKQKLNKGKEMKTNTLPILLILSSCLASQIRADATDAIITW